MKKLNPDIVKALAKKLGKTPGTIKKDIYLLRSNYSQSTVNAVAQLYAKANHTTVYGKLDKEDKASLPNIELEKEKITIKQKSKKTKAAKNKIDILISHQTSNPFRKGHIEELNRAYTYKCFTSVFILLRKIVENMLIDILRRKFPSKNLANKELYFDVDQNRFKDFSIIIANFRKKALDFSVDKKLVEKIADSATLLKDKSNDKAHSWFHLVKRKAEVDDLDPQTLIDLIAQLENNMSL
jgi:hypothetical protein